MSTKEQTAKALSESSATLCTKLFLCFVLFVKEKMNEAMV